MRSGLATRHAYPAKKFVTIKFGCLDIRQIICLCDHVKVSEIIERLGPGRIQSALGVGASSIKEARRHNQMPSAWFACIEQLCAQDGVPCDRSWFSFRQTECADASTITARLLSFDQDCGLISQALSEHAKIVVFFDVRVITSRDAVALRADRAAEKVLKDKDLFKADALLEIAGHLGNPIWALVEAPKLSDLDHLSASDLNGGGREVVEGAEQDGAQSSGAQKVNDFHDADVGLGPLADKASAA